jgi:hypothetical protein
MRHTSLHMPLQTMPGVMQQAHGLKSVVTDNRKRAACMEYKTNCHLVDDLAMLNTPHFDYFS